MFQLLRFGAYRTLGLISILAGLAACGGGGASSSNSPASSVSASEPLTITPSSITLHAKQGSSTPFTLTLTLNRQIVTGDGQIGIDDPLDAIASRYEIVSSNTTQAVVRFFISPKLSLGEHTGSIKFYVCKDDSCSNVYSQTPAIVQYHFTIDPVPPAATFSPITINISTIAGVPTQAKLDLQFADDVIGRSVNIHDAQNLFNQGYSFGYDANQHGTLTLSLTPINTPGVYTGVVSIDVCSYTPCDDTNMQAGSPVSVPYTVTVLAAPPAATLTQNTINLTVEQGDPASVTLDTKLADGVNAVFFYAHDANGLFTTDIAAFYGSTNQDYSLTLSLPPIQSTGTYTGTLNIEICGTYPQYSATYFCSTPGATPLPGSPMSIPYTITVTPFVPLPDVATTSTLPEWGTYQGSTEHTGFVPVTLNPATFSPRWNVPLSLSANPAGVTPTLSAVTTGNGKAAVSISGYTATGSLILLNELDGSIAWQHDFEKVISVGSPLVFGGRTFVSVNPLTGVPQMLSFDISDGSPIFQTAMYLQSQPDYGMAIKNGFMYVNAVGTAGMYKFNARTGATRWFTTLYRYNLWAPAVDQNYIYGYAGNDFSALNLNDGSVAVKFAASTPESGVTNTSPVLSGDGAALTIDGNPSIYNPDHLISYNLSAHTESWRLNGNFLNTPVANTGKIYLLNVTNSQLEAHDATNGNLLWTWQPDNAEQALLTGNLVLTNNLVFLSTSVATYAIDLTTHQSTWSVPHVGALALSSNKVLYISSQSDHTVYAYQLN